MISYGRQPKFYYKTIYLYNNVYSIYPLKGWIGYIIKKILYYILKVKKEKYPLSIYLYKIILIFI